MLLGVGLLVEEALGDEVGVCVGLSVAVLEGVAVDVWVAV